MLVRKKHKICIHLQPERLKFTDRIWVFFTLQPPNEKSPGFSIIARGASLDARCSWNGYASLGFLRWFGPWWLSGLPLGFRSKLQSIHNLQKDVASLFVIHMASNSNWTDSCKKTDRKKKTRCEDNILKLLGCSIREWPNPWTYQGVFFQGIEITARSTRSCSLSSLLFWMQQLSILRTMRDICASTIWSGFELSTFSFILSLQATWLQWQRKHPTEQLRFADIFQVTIWHLQQIFTQVSSKLCGGWETSVKIQMYRYVDNIYHIINIYTLSMAQLQ